MNIKYKDEKLKEKICSYLYLSHLSSDEQEKIILGLMDNVSNKISVKVLEKLKEEEAKKLEEISKKEDREEFLRYLNSRIEKFSDLVNGVVKEEVERFKKEISK